MNAKRWGRVALGFVLASASGAAANAQAIRNDAGFTANTLDRNDDESTDLVDLGFTFNFFGVTGSQAYVNNNGNITFDQALGDFIPFPLIGAGRQIIAPFFADVETRDPSPGVTQFGQSTIGGRKAFGVNWFDVGYFDRQIGKLNTFQLVLIDRSDAGAGAFDFEFNYGSILWETGEASGDADANGLCTPGEVVEDDNGDDDQVCASARAGWSNGNLQSFELAGSAVYGALLDGGPNALVSNSRNSDIAGRYVFEVRGGRVLPPPPSSVPEPSTVALLAAGVAVLGGGALRRRRLRTV